MARNEIVLAEYRYYVADLLTNNVIAEIPFTNVGFERALSKAGSFSGEIPVIEATKSLNLYETTMPGKTALYVLRNGVCVWGGIIWSRSYSPSNKSLTVDAREWISYLYHRAVWQTLFYGSEGIYCLKYQAFGGLAIVYTDVKHGFLVGDTVKVNSLNTALNGIHEITAVTPAAFSFSSTANLSLSPSSTGIARTIVDSYDITRDILGWLSDDFGNNQFVNDAIKPASENEYSITNKVMTSGLATLTTSAPHDLITGQLLEIVDVDSALNGYQIISAIPSSTSISFQVAGSTASISSTSLPGITTHNVVTKAIVTNVYTVGTKYASNNIIKLTTTVAHDLSVGDEIAIEMVDTEFNGRYTVASVPTSTTFTYIKSVENMVSTPVEAGELSYKTAVLVTSAPHGLTKNKTVVVEINDAAYDGTFVVSKVINSTTFRYSLFSTLNAAPEAVDGGVIKWGPRAVAGTYGSFSNNSDLGIGITDQISNKYIGLIQQVFRGSDLRYFGEILEDFTKDINGFEYRIDCDFQNGQFIRTFTFVPFIPPPKKVIVNNKQLASNTATLTTETVHGLEVGQEIVVTGVGSYFDGTITVESIPTATTFTYKSYRLDVPSTSCYGYIGLVHPTSVLGADQYVFEYPGNVLEFKIDESAENAATRMWVGGNNQGLDGEASQPYAAANALDLLGDGWPILDQIESSSNDLAGEQMLYDYAEEYLLEARPPEMTFNISVNGSLSPAVGDYLPGDWCTIIIDDDFVRMRLGSNLEPRSNVIVRKIVGYKVSVPDSPAFPEKVDLELVSEFKEDRRNAQQTQV
jgi:hypothetical protein